jgi:hypothetical protein
MSEPSSAARANTFGAAAPDTSAGAVASCSDRRCAWCRRTLEATARPDAVFCSRKCRQTAFRLRRRRTTEAANATPKVFAYADPPYPGRARKYYQREDTYGGEVDHVELLASLKASGYDGWALSTAADALRDLLPLCPPEARVCPWVKPIGASPQTFGLHNCWEPLIVVPGRRLRPGLRDFLIAQPARFGGKLPGRKPLNFCAFLFDALGMLPGDELVDLFPGTGMVGRAWAQLSSRYRDDASSSSPSDSVAEDLGDVSPPGGTDTSFTPAGATR